MKVKSHGNSAKGDSSNGLPTRGRAQQVRIISSYSLALRQRGCIIIKFYGASSLFNAAKGYVPKKYCSCYRGKPLNYYKGAKAQQRQPSQIQLEYGPVECYIPQAPTSRQSRGEGRDKERGGLSACYQAVVSQADIWPFGIGRQVYLP